MQKFISELRTEAQRRSRSADVCSLNVVCASPKGCCSPMYNTYIRTSQCCASMKSAKFMSLAQAYAVTKTIFFNFFLFFRFTFPWKIFENWQEFISVCILRVFYDFPLFCAIDGVQGDLAMMAHFDVYLLFAFTVSVWHQLSICVDVYVSGCIVVIFNVCVCVCVSFLLFGKQSQCNRDIKSARKI